VASALVGFLRTVKRVENGAVHLGIKYTVFQILD
jgi:hypothetical protein